MTRRWYSWPHWPTLLGAAVLAPCALLLMVNLADQALFGRRIVIFPGHLDGVTMPDDAPLSLHDVLSGRFQAVTSRGIGAHQPLYAASVRLRNQIEYSVFGVAGTPFLTVGRHRQLIENAYIEDYCTRDVGRRLQGADAWAAKIRQMQDDVERRGKIFLYVLTPSKVAQYPAILPRGYPCPSTEADRTGLVPAWLQILRRHGVHVADAIAPVTAAHGAYPFNLWPQGGTHWNQVGSALGTQAVTAALQAQRHDGVFAPFTFTWHMTPPQSPDNDLALLMNLRQTPDHYLVPALTVTWGPATCRPVNVTVVGGSFMIAIAQLLGQGPCHPQIAEYEYWRADRLTWPGGQIVKTDVDEARRAREVMDADVLLYEENEQLLGRVQHGPALYDFLSHQPGWRGD